ncbi:cysteine--tRNA ligase [Candidatus Woesearchaeota archaeon]|nr:cysteine--tRNA ligase [Candidatus Woesearchaeota archaeon]
MDIFLTNTLGKTKQRFTPITPGKVSIYTCGPTVYHYAHIGNLRSFVFADLLKRMFIANNYKVEHVMNITDVGHLTSDADDGEDKLEKGARREGKTVWEVAQYYTDHFMEDLSRLNIMLPDHMPKATDHIAEMISIIKNLEEKGYTYIAEGNVYFDTQKYAEYADFAGLKLNEEDARSRVDEDEHKKSPFDFVLWFTRYKYSSHEMEWDSPWGRGFPGWHIECSAMSTKYLGDHFDIHTGGIDHIPVHHTNEIAQSTCAFGHKWVNYWMHNNFLVLGEDEKISKSKDNFLRLQTLMDKGISGLDYRYFLLGAHYRKPQTFSFEGLEAAKTSLRKLVQKYKDVSVRDGRNEDEFDIFYTKFLEAMNDDLNTPQALAVFWETVQDTNIDVGTKRSLFDAYDAVLGIGLKEQAERKEEIPDDVLALKSERDKARVLKNWAESDRLRDEIVSKGFEVLDSKDGTEIRKA